MKAARMQEYGKPLVLEDIPVPDITPDDILVKVEACGMCRSDVQLIDGYFRPYADIPTPITPGHEISGVIHRMSARVFMNRNSPPVVIPARRKNRANDGRRPIRCANQLNADMPKNAPRLSMSEVTPAQMMF